jgi:hypothetical protein
MDPPLPAVADGERIRDDASNAVGEGLLMIKVDNQGGP